MKRLETQAMRGALSLLALLFTAAAASAEPDLTECANEQSDAARLACYDRMARGAADDDRQASEAKSEAEPQAADPAVAGATEPGAATDETAAAIDNFGMNRNVAAANDQAPPELDQIYATIVEIETRRYGKRVFTLDNGQVWVEQSTAKSVRLEPGDEVRIKAGVLGSFKLFDSNRRSTRVERIR